MLCAKNRFFNICDRNCPIYLETKHTCVNVVVFKVRKETIISNLIVQHILQLWKCNVLTESHWIGDFTKCLHRKKRFWCNSYQKERLRRRKTHLHFVPFLTSNMHAHAHKHKTQRQSWKVSRHSPLFLTSHMNRLGHLHKHFVPTDRYSINLAALPHSQQML